MPAAWAGRGAQLEVLDTINRRIVRASEPPVDLTKALGTDCHPIDFAPVSGGWLVSDRAGRVVAQVAPDGSLVRKWSGFQRPGRIETGAAGAAFVHDELATAIVKLEPDGKTTALTDRPYATPVPADGGGVWLARPVFGRAVVGVVKPGGAPAVVAVLKAGREGSAVQGVEIAGATADGHVVLALHEGRGDDRHGMRLVRMAADGRVLAEGRAPPLDERWLTVPRFYRPAGPGAVTSFRTAGGGWTPLSFPLQDVKPVEPPGVAPDAAAQAREALCRGTDAKLARNAALSAAHATAFETASPYEAWVTFLHEDGVPARELCLLVTAEEHIGAGRVKDAADALAGVLHEKLADRRLFALARIEEARGELRPALRAYQRIVLDHPSSTFHGAAQEAVLRIVESGKLPGAR